MSRSADLGRCHDRTRTAQTPARRPNAGESRPDALHNSRPLKLGYRPKDVHLELPGWRGRVDAFGQADERLDWLKLDEEGEEKSATAPVFSNEAGEPVGFLRGSWEAAVLNAHGVKPVWQKGGKRLAPECQAALRRIDLRWHDLRHEYASRLVQRGVPLSLVRDLLGHASITTTERYDNQTQDALLEAAKRLETGESFQNLSRSAKQLEQETQAEPSAADPKVLQYVGVVAGVGDGVRTRDFRSHSPALCR